jgi:hypothetical protein
MARNTIYRRGTGRSSAGHFQRGNDAGMATRFRPGTPVKRALAASLGHFQQLLQLIESDSPSTGWPGGEQLDGDALARLVTKLCR